MDTRQRCSPSYLTKILHLQKACRGNQKIKQADPLACLLAALVSTQLWLPRTPLPHPTRHQVNMSLAQYAQLPDPKGSPVQKQVSAAGPQLRLPPLEEPTICPQWDKRDK